MVQEDDFGFSLKPDMLVRVTVLLVVSLFFMEQFAGKIQKNRNEIIKLIVVIHWYSVGQNATFVELSASCTIHGNIPQPVGTLRWDVLQEYFKTKSRSRWLSGQRVRLLCGRSPDRILATYLCYKHVGNVTGCHADLYTVSRCCTRGESQEFMARRQQSTQARDPPWLWNPGETSSEVQNRRISSPTKRTHVFQKFI